MQHHKKIRIGIFFGGQSREKEVSFAGGRTVYDSLDKNLFIPVPILIDNLGNFILLKWQYLYQGTIRDFYPDIFQNIPNHSISNLENNIQKIGEKIYPTQFQQYFDFAFLVLHGKYGEDGMIQAILEWYQIPYSGTGIIGTALGINKKIQNKWMSHHHICTPQQWTIEIHQWYDIQHPQKLLTDIIQKIGLPFIVKSNTQGSSIGISYIQNTCTTTFIQAVEKSFFHKIITAKEWLGYTKTAKKQWIDALLDIRNSIGLPVSIEKKIITHPQDLLIYLEQHFSKNNTSLILKSIDKETQVICEEYIQGREFSCIVITDEKQNPIALPPTEIIQHGSYFDYNAKYLPGLVHKQTPIPVKNTIIQQIRQTCVNVFKALQFAVFARIDGILTPTGQVYIIDPNTTSGMMPSSFLFHQAAYIGLNPTAFFTLIISHALQAREKHFPTQKKIPQLIDQIHENLAEDKKKKAHSIKVGILMGGFSEERHISLESGRNIYQKLAASTKYTPIPIFLSGSKESHQLFILPIHLLLKDNADDIHSIVQNEKIQTHHTLSILQQEISSFITQYTDQQIAHPKKITYQSLQEHVSFVFIALHGRPGEDGTIQKILFDNNIPYNGSDAKTSALCIDKYKTNQFLSQKGYKIAKQICLDQTDWHHHTEKTIKYVEQHIAYPLIIKPIDEGCSAGVISIHTKKQLTSYLDITFQNKTSQHLQEAYQILKLPTGTVIPIKKSILIEEMIIQGPEEYLIEITGGLITSQDKQKKITYEVFPPSETIAHQKILSLEEKFLAGIGQNITPARFHQQISINKKIQTKVQITFQNIAQLLNIQGYARIDAFVKIKPKGTVEILIIEINTLPAMTPATCIFHQSALHGYTPYALIDTIIQDGFSRHNTTKKSCNMLTQ